MEQINLLIRNCTVLPMTAEASDSLKAFRGNIGIAAGKIIFADNSPEELIRFTLLYGKGNGDAEASSERLRVIDGNRFIAMPGLINLHNHVAMTLLRSYADEMPLMRWLNEKIWPLEAHLTPDDVALGTRLGIAEMLLGGTTTFVDMYLMADRVAETALESGIRAVVGPTLFDNRAGELAGYAAETIERFDGAGNGRITVRVAPHAPYTNSPETIRKAITLCERFGVGINIHLSETRDELDIIRKTYGKTPTAYLDDLGVFRLRTLAAHCVHLNDTEIDLLAARGVSISHNPQSNMKLASGVAPVTRMLARGLNVGIGTDGPSSNNDLDLWDEMRTASLLQKSATGDPGALPAYQTLQMATVHGAKALGLQGVTGQITPGSKADIILIDREKPHLCPMHNLISNLVYCGKAADVDTVIVDGRILVEKGILLHTDLAELRHRVQERAMELAGMVESG